MGRLRALLVATGRNVPACFGFPRVHVETRESEGRGVAVVSRSI